MNSQDSHSIAGRCLGLLLSLAVAGSVYAGPGPQYWQALGKPAVIAAATAPAEKAVCPGCKLVAVTVMRATSTNGRGPQLAVQIGTERVCSMCAGTAAVMKASWSNGRGPLAPVAAAATSHGCTSCCTRA